MAEARAPPARGWRARRRRVRPGLIDRYLLRGVAGPFLLITLAVGAAMMLERALRLIHELAASGADIGYFLPLLVQLIPYYLNLALPAAFMVALVLLVARLDDRLELEAMLASGLSLSRIAAPLVAFGVLIGLAGLVAGGWLEPLGRYGFRSLRIEALNSGRIGRLEARALYHPVDSLAVTFDRREPDGSVSGIFVWQRLADGRELVLTGEAGRIGFSRRARLFGIDLESGLYHSERPGSEGGSSQLLRFDSLAFRESLRLEDSSWARGWDQKELTLTELLAAEGTESGRIPRRAIQSEYLSRIARAVTIPLLPLLVLPLAFATKRGRRGVGILLCGAVLAAVHHGLNMAKKFGLGGTLDPHASLIGATLLCAAIVLLIFRSGRHLPSHSPLIGRLGPVGRGLGRLGRRARRLPSLRGRTIATYLAWQIGKGSLIALLAIVVLLQMVDLFERGEDFVDRDFGLAGIGRYALLRLPPMIQQALPIAALAGAMAAFAGLGRSREMTAIRAAGISQWRILTMALPVPVLMALASYLLAERVAPLSQPRFAAWWAQTAPTRQVPREEARWFRIGADIVRAGGASEDGARLVDVRIFRRDHRGLLVERVSAASATASAAGWSLAEVEVARFGSATVERRASARLDWAAPLDPGDVATFFSSARSLSSAAARRSLSELAPVSQSGALFATRLHRSAAEPLAPLVMLLLALPLAFVPPRRGTPWPAMLYAGCGGLIYLVADGVLTVAAQVGYLPAAVGAWAAPVIVALTGATVLLYSER
ncbi:MAG TPA: LptF/LptG family permease [Allosphingosinicella sp.]|nr:LptF/LptG family permease [Allosphingosinicella sp.]